MVRPLEGVKVVDLSRLAPGPFCTMVLADMGAEVLRVEAPPQALGEKHFAWLPEEERERRRASAFNALNRGKRSICLNLKHPEGQAILRRLCQDADVFVEEFRPGVTRRLGCDYETLRSLNPRLIYCSLTGYGQDGPYRDLVGHDINYISIGGALGLIGPKGGPPSIPYNLLADFAGGGMHAALAILGALLAREKTGEGQYLDIAMTDGVAYLLASAYSEYFRTGLVPRPGQTRLNGAVPYYNVYECADGKYISIGCIEPWFWRDLCKALGLEEYIPHQFDQAKHPEIFEALRRVFRTRTRDEWFDYLTKAGDIAVGKVYTLDEAVQDPQLQARGMFPVVGEVEGEPVRQVGVAPRLTGTPLSPPPPGPVPGQHTDEVLAELGYPPEEVRRLREQGVVA